METGGSTPNASAERKITFLAAGAFDTGLTMFLMWKIGYDTRVFSVTDLSAKSIAPFGPTVTFSSSALRRMAFQMSGSFSFERLITLA